MQTIYNKIERSNSQVFLCLFWLLVSKTKYSWLFVLFCFDILLFQWLYVTVEQLLSLTFISLKTLWHRNWVFIHLSLSMMLCPMKMSILYSTTFPFFLSVSTPAVFQRFGVWGFLVGFVCLLVCLLHYVLVQFHIPMSTIHDSFLWKAI